MKKRTLYILVIVWMVVTFALLALSSCTKEAEPDGPDIVLNMPATIFVAPSEPFTIDVSKSIAYGGHSIDTLTIYKDSYPRELITSTNLIYVYSIDSIGTHPLIISVIDSRGWSDRTKRNVVVK